MPADRFTKKFAKRFSRRAFMLLGIKLGLTAAVAVRLYKLQIEEAEQYRILADDNQINTRVISPVRGEIFDRNGDPLAVNYLNYRVVVTREQIKNPDETLNSLRELIQLSEKDILRIKKEMRQRSAFIPILVKEHLSWEEFSRINLNAPALPGVQADVGWTRFYPHQELLGHSVGYVSSVTEKDREKNRGIDNDPLLMLPDFQIGKNGIEFAIDKKLRGIAGRSHIEVNALGRVIRELKREEAQAGAKINLTLDLKLQEYAMKCMKDESAGAVVMDVRNGDILALISAPSYNPNSFVRGISHREWNSLLENDHRPLVNKATAGLYPPGSTFKMIVALAALKHGVVTPEETVFCNGKFQLGTETFHCWKRPGHGSINLKNSIKHSCDVYFYEIAGRLGIEKIIQMANDFGLGVDTPIDLPNVQAGLMPTKEWKRQVKNDIWRPGDTINAGIGQGYLLTTPLQLAIMTARIANGQFAVKPRLVRAINGIEVPVELGEPLDINPEHMAVIHDSMNAVCNEQGGTAHRSRIADPENQMAGKTGTAQVRRITKSERVTGVRKNEDLPWRFRDHALFASYAPAHDPKYAIGIIVEHGGGGSAVAAPIARDIMMAALYNGTPPLGAYPPEVRQEILNQQQTG
jgi:penicillin-binding protein 2